MYKNAAPLTMIFRSAEATEQAIQHWQNSGDFEMILVTAGGELLMTEGIAANYTAKKEIPCRVVYSDEEP